MNPMRMDDRERRIGWYLAIAAVPVLMVITTPWKGVDHLGPFAFTLLFPGSFALVVKQRHRVWTSVAAFLIGLLGPWSFAYLAGAPFVAYAFWLASRARKLSKAVAIMSAPDDPTEGDAPPAGRFGRRRPPRTAASRRASTSPSAPARKPSSAGVDSGRVTPKGTSKRRSPKRS